VQGLHRPADERDHLHLVDRPAQPRAGQRRRRRVRQHPDPVGADQPRQRRPDAVQHRVAAGQHAHLPPGVLVEQAGQRGHQRRRPGHPDAGDRGRQQVELAAAAEQHLGRDHGGAGGLGQARPAVRADAHHRQRRARLNVRRRHETRR
jgi:hypothetical protein